MYIVKSLNKTFKKDIKSNLSYYISIALLTMITVFLAVVAFTDVDMIDKDINNFQSKNKVEDAQFRTALLLSDGDISALENKYDVLIEENSYLETEDGDKTYRIFRPMTKLNKYEVLEGDCPENENDIVIDRDNADANSIRTGDRRSISGVTFKVTGLGVRPD